MDNYPKSRLKKLLKWVKNINFVHSIVYKFFPDHYEEGLETLSRIGDAITEAIEQS